MVLVKAPCRHRLGVKLMSFANAQPILLADDALGFRTRGASLFRLDILQLDAITGREAGGGLLDPGEKPGVVLQPVIEPILLRGKADQYPRRLAISRDHDLRFLRLAQKTREIILHRGQRDPLHSGSPNCASHASASDLATTARISTVSSDTS